MTRTYIILGIVVVVVILGIIGIKSYHKAQHRKEVDNPANVGTGAKGFYQEPGK